MTNFLHYLLLAKMAAAGYEGVIGVPTRLRFAALTPLAATRDDILHIAQETRADVLMLAGTGRPARQEEACETWTMDEGYYTAFSWGQCCNSSKGPHYTAGGAIILGPRFKGSSVRQVLSPQNDIQGSGGALRISIQEEDGRASSVQDHEAPRCKRGFTWLEEPGHEGPTSELPEALPEVSQVWMPPCNSTRAFFAPCTENDNNSTSGSVQNKTDIDEAHSSPPRKSVFKTSGWGTLGFFRASLPENHGNLKAPTRGLKSKPVQAIKDKAFESGDEIEDFDDG